ncbi:unnamed protein product [Mytilus coruscus]|uniref:TRPM SLOG domain-containing protein n=1 Tax=Mytilus coruscus TaxID=42192 RepID=A0A6J8BRY3_MYTCO|nr:unnamed protein product [Mytilus coruscus]
MGKDLLLRDLPIKWTMPEPEAVISITGIDHQFNIKDNCKLKRDLIEAVISTESWIVTCGTESGAVRFIEEAVNAHVAMKNCNIPIVGILPQRVYDEMREENKPKEVISIERRKKDNWVKIPCISTQEVLDPIHTQFIFTNNVKRNQTGSEATCREAFEHFLLNINIKETDAELETHEILPVVLVLIEGGIHALRTAKSVLNHEHHVVVIDGSGGVADFLAACYFRDTRERNGEIPDQNVIEVIEEHFEDDPDSLQEEIKELSEWFMQKDKKEKHAQSMMSPFFNEIDERLLMSKGWQEVHSLSTIDHLKEIIQTIMTVPVASNLVEEYHQQKINGMKQKNALKTNAVKEQLKLVEKWQRCDLAKKDIFIAKNRKHLTSLQTLNTKRMYDLQNKIGDVVERVMEDYDLINRKLPAYYKRFVKNTSQLKDVSNTQYFWVLSTSFDKLVEHMPVYYLDSKTGKRKTCDEKGMEELRMEIKREIQQVYRIYKSISKNILDSCEEFQKAVLQFEEVNKKKAQYFSVLSDKFKKIISYMTVDAINIHKQELREIVKDIVDYKIETSSQRSYLSVIFLSDEASENCIDIAIQGAEYKKDMVSQLLLTSIISNRKDLVELTMGKIENIEAFVFDKLANIYWRCIKESPEDLPIKLIEQVSNIEVTDKYGWDVVEEFVDDPIVESTEEATRLKQAEYRAKMRRRDKSVKADRPNPYYRSPVEEKATSDLFRRPKAAYTEDSSRSKSGKSVFTSSKYFGGKKGTTRFNYCNKGGHWAYQCPRKAGRYPQEKKQQ